jgi:RiboL-PSP-HEPN
MWVCIGRLKEGLTLLRHYLDGLDKQDRLLALNPETCGDGKQQVKELQDHFRTKNNKARYDYNTIVISLYGYLERFVEDLIGEYLTLISSYVPTFSELPSPIQGNHLPLSLELARKADYQRYAGSVRVDDVVARLHACFNTPDKYQLNDQAFAQHSANFRQSVVATTFSQFGIADIGPSLRQAEPFAAFLEKEDPERDVQTYLAGGDEVVFARLNDLANRRNDVAHGTPVDDILSRDLLRSHIGFVEAYASGLALVVYERSLPFMLKRAVALGSPIAVYDHRIVCVNLPAGQITVGDTLIAKTPDISRPFKAGTIREIEQDHIQLNTINGGPGVQIGMLVEFGAKDNQEFYFLNTTS